MFDHLRQDQTADLTAAHNALAAAQQSLQPLRDQISVHQARQSTAQSALDAAAATAQQANATYDAAQSLVNQRQTARANAATAVASATQNLADILDSEPDSPLPNGKPNPAIAGWRARVTRATAQVHAAQTSLDQADASLGQANQARAAAANVATTAAAAVTVSQATVISETQGLQSAHTALATAESSLAGLQQAVDARSAQLADLDARGARLVAQPLNRPDLEAAAETEIAALSAQRQHRHNLLVHRANRVADQASLLASEDQDIAALVPIRDAIAGWPDAGRFAALGTATAALDAVITAAHVQQGRPTTQRTDDLGAARTGVAHALSALNVAIAEATAARDQRSAALDAAAAALATNQQVQP